MTLESRHRSLEGRAGGPDLAYVLVHRGKQLDRTTIVDALAQRVSDGQIPGALLDASGWQFTRDGLEKFAKRRVKTRDAAA